MNKTNHNLETLRANGEKKRLEKMERIDKLAKNVLVNYPKGFTVKEVAIDTKMLPNTVRRWVDELIKDGRVQKIGVEGKVFIFCLSDFLTDKQEEAAKEEVAKVEETVKEEPQKVCAGREFKDPRSVTSVVAGDISWISSRSGNGLFFRYLILIVHSYKATCVNVFPEGHEAVNVNDPNFIYIGDDPESGERLWADLTNVCQRRFSAFGERCMHISPGSMENVKNRMARLLKVDIRPVGDQGTVKKLRDNLAKISTDYTRLNNDYNKLNDEFTAYKKDKEQYCEGLRGQVKNLVHDKQEADKKRDSAIAQYESLEQHYKSLLNEHKRYVAAQPDKPSDEPKEESSLFDDIRNDNAILGMIIDGKTKEAQIKLLEKQNEQLYNLLDNLSLNNRKEV